METGSPKRVLKPRGKYRINPNRVKLQPFIRNLVGLLTDPLASNAVHWEEMDGYGLVSITNRDELASNLLLKYFKHQRVESFIRQLNIHGFKKISKRKCTGIQDNYLVYAHQYFLKSSSQLHVFITRGKPTATTQELASLKELTLRKNITILETAVKDQKDINQEEWASLLGLLKCGSLAPFSPLLQQSLLLIAATHDNRSVDYFKLQSKDVNYERRLLSICNEFINNLKSAKHDNIQKGPITAATTSPSSEDNLEHSDESCSASFELSEESKGKSDSDLSYLFDIQLNQETKSFASEDQNRLHQLHKSLTRNLAFDMHFCLE